MRLREQLSRRRHATSARERLSMYSNPMNTLADAYEVIRRYGLEYGFLVDGGSAQGFAA